MHAILCIPADMKRGRQFKTIGRTLTEADLVSFVNTTGMVEVLFTI